MTYFSIDVADSTTFANLAASAEPIVYFNIGFGLHTHEAEKAVRKRCIWIDVDISNPGNLVTQLNDKIKQNLTNEYTSMFCLSDREETRERTTINVLNSLLKYGS